jgi:hypothetical protein
MSPQLRCGFSGPTKSLGLRCPYRFGGRKSVHRRADRCAYRSAYRSAGYSDYYAPVSYSGYYREDGVIISGLGVPVGRFRSGLHSADAQRLRNLSV